MSSSGSESDSDSSLDSDSSDSSEGKSSDVESDTGPPPASLVDVLFPDRPTRPLPKRARPQIVVLDAPVPPDSR
jgi:hypothetical protein